MARRRSTSIWTRLVVGLVSIAVLAVIVASVVLYFRFKAASDDFREQTLQAEARLIGRIVKRAKDAASIKAAVDDMLRVQRADAVYAVSDPDDNVIAGSPGLTKPIWATDDGNKKEFFVRTGSGNAPPLYGITLKTEYLGRPAFVQVAFAQPEVFFDSLLAEFLADIAWIWIPFVVGLVILNLLIVKTAIRPLDRVVAQVEAIRPHQSTRLLDEEGLPSEVQPLVSGMNRAVRRMNAALDTQANFIADASHELRTPISVLKAHLDILPRSSATAAIREEVHALARLVEQLLDSARLDSIGEAPGHVVDLCDLAREVASHLGPSAILEDKSIELTTELPQVRVLGEQAFLFRALRNVVENALHHTPAGTQVSIDVHAPGSVTVVDRGPGIPPEMRERIFQKYWQGARDRSAGGAGLGMDIVRRTMEALGGRVSIGEAAGGGASVTLTLPGA